MKGITSKSIDYLCPLNERPITKNIKKPTACAIHKSSSQVIKQSELKAIITHLKSEIIHISLDKTSKSPLKATPILREMNNSFNEKPHSPPPINLKTEIDYSIAPMNKDSNGFNCNELTIPFKQKQYNDSILNSRGKNPKTKSLQSKLKPKKDKSFEATAVVLTESNGRGIKKAFAQKSEVPNKLLSSNIQGRTQKPKLTNTHQTKEYQNEIVKLKEENRSLRDKCNEFNEKIILLTMESKEYETMLNDRNALIEKQSKLIETLTTQNSIQMSNVQSNEKLSDELFKHDDDC